MKLKLRHKIKLYFDFLIKHRIKIHFDFLRQQTPIFDEQVKHFVWGTGEKIRETDTIPKIIWLYWHDEKISSITVQLCINHIKNLHPAYDVNMLNKGNIMDYLPKFPTGLLEKPSNFVSDMVRLMLLEQHGGIYLDATVLLSKQLNWTLSIQQQDQSEAVVYYSDEGEYPMVETWFIAAIPQSKFIKAWREEYRKCMLSSNPSTYYESNSILPLSEFPLDPTYYASYMAGQIVMRRSKKYRLSMLRAKDDAFLYGQSFKKEWDEKAMAEVLLFNKKSKVVPNLVKLIRFDRRRLDFYIQRGFYKNDSWLGELLNKPKAAN